MRKVFVFVGVLLPLCLYGAFESKCIEPLIIARGEAVCASPMVWSWVINPAGVCCEFDRSFWGGSKLAEGFAEEYYWGFSVPVFNGGVGVDARVLSVNGEWMDANGDTLDEGAQLYGEYTGGVGLGWRLGDVMSIGVRVGFGYASFVGDEYAPLWMMDVSGGMVIQVYEKWRLGFCVMNFAPHLSYDVPANPVELQGGLSYAPYDGMDMELDLRYSLFRGMSLHSGGSFTVYDDKGIVLITHCGVETDPVAVGAGLELGWQMVKVQYTYQYRTFLGDSYIVGVSLSF